jgi:NitT/TauT family transport system substrate-binding protein
MAAIFAQSIDLTYVGPGPALNAYTKSNGAQVRLFSPVERFLHNRWRAGVR